MLQQIRYQFKNKTSFWFISFLDSQQLVSLCLCPVSTENKNRDPGEREFLVDDQQIDREKLGETLPYLGQKLEWDSEAKELEAQTPNTA